MVASRITLASSPNSAIILDWMDVDGMATLKPIL
jgi:hypothetical protein